MTYPLEPSKRRLDPSAVTGFEEPAAGQAADIAEEHAVESSAGEQIQEKLDIANNALDIIVGYLVRERKKQTAFHVSLSSQALAIVGIVAIAIGVPVYLTVLCLLYSAVAHH